MTQTKTYRAVALNFLPSASEAMGALNQAVFDVPRLTLNSALELASYWRVAGYCAVVYSYDQVGNLLGVTYRGDRKTVAKKFELPNLYVSTWRGTVEGSNGLSIGAHAAVLDAKDHRIFALTGDAHDSESIESACLFAAAPRLYSALQDMLDLFAKEFQPGESVVVDTARRVMNSVHERNKYDL